MTHACHHGCRLGLDRCEGRFTPSLCGRPEYEPVLRQLSAEGESASQHAAADQVGYWPHAQPTAEQIEIASLTDLHRAEVQDCPSRQAVTGCCGPHDVCGLGYWDGGAITTIQCALSSGGVAQSMTAAGKEELSMASLSGFFSVDSSFLQSYCTWIQKHEI